MVIKSGKEYLIVGLSIVVLTTLVSFVIADMGYILVSIALAVLSIAGAVSYSIVVGRTVTMDQSGFTISLLKYQRFYKWEDLVIRRMEGPHMGLRNSNINGGVFFSLKKVRKPEMMDPALYCSLFHPVSCFFVFFSSLGNNDKCQGIYPVNKDRFVEQLKEWGVKLDNA